MTEIVTVRHGQTDWNAVNRLQGQLDIPLSYEGKKQALGLKEGLSKIQIDAYYSSCLSRAKCTAETIRESHPNTPLTIIEDLQEIDFGIWQACLVSEIAQRYPERYRLWREDPTSDRGSGETLDQFKARVIPAWERVLEDCETKKYQRVLIVAHKYTIQVILCHVSDLDLIHCSSFPQENCALNLIEYKDGIAKVRVTNKQILEMAEIAA